MKNKYTIPALAAFFTLVALLYIADLYCGAKACDGYIIGDWLINYDAGFVRRGLCGSLILVLSDLIRVKPNFVVMFIEVALHLAYMSILFVLILRKKINVWFMILLLSPATLLFPILNSYAVGRKEIILFFLFGTYVLWLTTNKPKAQNDYVVLLFALLLSIATFFHELTFFYTPYFVLATYIKSKSNNSAFSLPKSAITVLAPILAMVPIYLFGKSINGDVICTELVKRGLSNGVCNGILSWPNNYSYKDVLKLALENDYFRIYSTCLVLGLIPFVLFVNHARVARLGAGFFLLTFIGLLMFSLPLFVMAVDWGRWISIHFTLLLFTATLLLKERGAEPNEGGQNEGLSVSTLWKFSSPWAMRLRNVCLGLMCFCYLAFWHLGFFGWFKVFSLNTYLIYSRSVYNLMTLAYETKHWIF